MLSKIHCYLYSCFTFNSSVLTINTFVPSATMISTRLECQCALEINVETKSQTPVHYYYTMQGIPLKRL